MSVTKRIEELSQIDLADNKALATYARTGRDLCRDLAAELEFAAEQLVEALASIGGNPRLLGADARVRARLVARHMARAAEAVRVAGASLVACRASFERHFEAELAQVRKTSKPATPKFRFVEE